MTRNRSTIASTLAIVTTIFAMFPANADPSVSKNMGSNKIDSNISWVTPKEATMRLTLTPNFTSTGERILNLDMIVGGKVVDRVQAVSGKPQAQYFRTGGESKAGSREPLPQGLYQVGAIDRGVGLPLAMGDTFIPMTPLFATSRSGIGIHRDADRHLAGGSGTIGCLGVLNQQGIDSVAQFVTTYRPKTLWVNYGVPTNKLI